MMRVLVSLCAVVAVVAAVVGCEKKQVVDPYTKASLREAVYGEVVSDGFMYKIVNPQIVDSLENYLIVRQTNLTEFVIGNQIADQVAKIKDKSSLTFNVIKRFSPMVHFQCINVVSPSDSIVIPHDKPIAFPRTADAATFEPPSGYEFAEMTQFRYDDSGGLRDRAGKKFSLRAKLVRVEEDSVSVWYLEGDVPCPSPFMLKQENIQIPRLRVKKPRPSLEIVMRLLYRTKTDFTGGVTYTEVEPWADRQKNYVCGTVEIGYVRLLDKVFLR